ncbi:type II toxin-antitoxin system VapC family toxin [Segetibacter aerophilus]|uniref:Twitching motility protein PilT n=1 Tax=Segetibacter aerophilus TaxID=670293 RepID=A0A512BCY9_9BACT|nr:type II toxin-antitoxin system VapC family toxin [Segetibacter aerophilus]GEO09831.1 twitching motility protein PilT [Segetibacter aerophilus]
MSRYLLDTHTLIWWNEGDKQLSQLATKTIENLANSLYVSIASFWEITIKLQTGKLKLDYYINELAAACITSNIEIVPVKLYHLNQLSLLPVLHKDSFDRMLAAIAYSDHMTLISKDKQLGAYNISVI